MAFSMIVTGSSALTMLRNRINDPPGSASPRFKDAQLLAYLNMALVKVTRELETAIDTTWKITLATDDQEISVPPNLMFDKKVSLTMAPSDVRWLTYLNLEQMTDYIGRDPTRAGTPQFYWFWRRLGSDLTIAQPTIMRLWPKVDASAHGKDMRIYGYKLPDEVTESNLANLVELDVEYLEPVILWASSLAKEDDMETARSSKLAGQYELEIQKLKGLKARRSRSARPRIRPRITGALGRISPPWKPFGSNWGW